MKKLFFSALACFAIAYGCQPAQEKMSEKDKVSAAKNAPAVALCEFTPTDSATAVQRLTGKWELKGIQTNYMGGEDKFLTGEQITEAKTIIFFEDGQFEEYIDGKLQGERQRYNLVGQSLTPLGYQFWFCGENTLVLNNVIVDGPTDVYVKQ